MHKSISVTEEACDAACTEQRLCATAVAFQVCVTHTAQYGQAPHVIKHCVIAEGYVCWLTHLG